MNANRNLRASAALAAAMLCCGVIHAQDAKPAAPADKPSSDKLAAEMQQNPFAPQPAPPLPAGMTGSDANDPRFKLKPGMYDAGELAMGMEHIDFVKKAPVFNLPSDDPNDPSVDKAIQSLGVPPGMKIPPPMKMVIAGLALANSDLAFSGHYLFQGNFFGMSIFDISDPAKTSLITTMVCPGGQGDVSVYGHLMFMSVEMPNGRIDCGAQAFPPDPPPAAGHEHEHHVPSAQKDRFRGVRIFDISDIRNPKQIAAVQTCRGSHTHTLLVDPNDHDNIYVYVSGTSFVRQPEELAGCSGEAPDKDPNTALFRIDVIKVPLAHPEKAAIVSSPRVFMNPTTMALNGLNNGGTHDSMFNPKEPNKPTDTDQCHDITVDSWLGLAAGACSGNGILLDIKDPVHPKRVDAVNDPNYSYWHSATFSNDGSKVVFTDEWGGGMGARCRPNDPNKWGADAIFDINKADDKLAFQGYYKMPAAQGDTENCVAHNGSLVPVPGRDIEVQAWYQGGISVMDFTDPKHPMEIAYYDRGAINPNMLVLGGDWSAYWFNGYIYGSEIARGLDVLKLTPSKYLTQNEIDAANTIHFDTLNVQDQPHIVWGHQLVVAKAYLDQLGRDGSLPMARVMEMQAAIDKAAHTDLHRGKEVERLKMMGAKMEADAASAKTPEDAKRMHELAKVLNDPQV